MKRAPAIHQIVAGYREGDAISNCADVMRQQFRRWGNSAEIVCDPRNAAPQVRDQILPIETAAATLRPEDVVLLHLSTGSRMNQLFPSLPGRKVILYHNVTPHHYFRYCNPALAEELKHGREQVAALAGVAELNLADSAYNAAELRELGYRDVEVLPLTIDIEAYTPGAADEALRERFSDGVYNILFVGRCAPNKKIEDLLTAVRWTQRFVEPNVRLIHAGSYAGAEVYRSMLLAQAREQEIRDLQMLGPVSPAELNACYAVADLFLCLSEHEGFCAPLVEAMLHGIPVLARAAAAVPETLGGAGILFEEVDFALIAETISQVLHDKQLRGAIVERQEKRVQDFRGRELDRELRELFGRFLA